MATSKIDEICPPEVGSEIITLTVSEIDVQPTAYVPLEIAIDYSRAGAVGVSLPLELVFQGPLAGQRQRRLFEHALPSSVLLTPRSGGRHFILIRELHHNRWQGRLFIDVAGDDVQQSEDR